MFHYISGELVYKDLTTCVIDTVGIGYRLTVSALTSAELSSSLGKEAKLFTHLAVREDGIELFGFISEEERETFEKLTTVSGVGPKAAISILSIMTPDDLAAAIYADDTKAIAKASGIGPKTAQRIIVDLKDKMPKTLPQTGASQKPAAKNAVYTRGMAEAAEALSALGYDRTTVSRALSDIDPSVSDTGEIVRLALKKLAR